MPGMRATGNPRAVNQLVINGTAEADGLSHTLSLSYEANPAVALPYSIMKAMFGNLTFFRWADDSPSL